jgi:hypothetical protein
MKKRILVYKTIFFISLLNGCCNDNTTFDMLNEKIKIYSKNRFSLSEDIFIDKYYLYSDSYFEVPMLPYGFFLFYKKDYPLPFLDTLKRFEEAMPYSGFMVNEIFVYHDAIVMRNENDYYCISFSNHSDFKKIEFIPHDFEAMYSFIPISKFNIGSRYTQNIYGLVDNDYLKEYNVNYATPIIRCIISLGLTDYKNDHYIFGESLYGYFSMSLTSGIIFYYKDEIQFNNYIASIADPGLSLTKSSYNFLVYRTISGKKKILSYSIRGDEE